MKKLLSTNGAKAKKRLLSATCLMGALPFVASAFSGVVAAQDVTVDTEENTPIVTNTRIGTGPGTLTITSDGSVVLANGIPLTLNGPHNLLLQGNLVTDGLTNQTGLLIDTSDLTLTSNIDLFSAITIDGPDDQDPTTLSNNTGILFAGANGFVGNLNLNGAVAATDDQPGFSGADILVTGSNSRGVAFDTSFSGDINFAGRLQVVGENSVGFDFNAPIVGDVDLRGTTLLSNGGSTAIFVRDTITGRLGINSAITVGEASTFDADGNLVLSQPANAAIVINADVTGGLLIDGIGVNNRRDTDGDGTLDFPDSDQTITSIGGATALRIENIATDGSDLRLGAVTDLDGTDLGYGFVFRSGIAVDGESSGLAANSIFIGSADGAGATVIEGGILFDTGGTSLEAVDADATGVIFGRGADVARFDLVTGGVGAFTATGSSTDSDGNTVNGPGGNAIAILIEEGANLPVINHQALAINVIANGDGTDAVGIRDLSGSLRELNVIGADVEIAGVATTVGAINVAHGGDNAGDIIAVDVRANTNGFSLYSSGTIDGDLLLGSGNDIVTLDGIEQVNSDLQTGGFLNGDIDFGLGADTFRLNNNARFLGDFTFDGSLDLQIDTATLTLAAGTNLSVTSATFGGVTTLNSVIDPIAGQFGSVTVQDQLLLTGTVDVNATFQSFVVSPVEFVLVDAGSILSPGGMSNLSLANTPFLFEASLIERTLGDRDQIVLRLEPLSAQELGLTRRLTEYYEAIQTTLVPDTQLETTIANLPDADAVSEALQGLAPDYTNRVFEMALANQRVIGRNLTERLDDFIHNLENPTGLWAVEHAEIGDIGSAENFLEADYQNFGLSIGYTGRLRENFAIGVGAGFSLIGSSTDSIGNDISIFAPYISGYWLYKNGGFYAGGSGTATLLDIKRDRSLFFLDLPRTIESTSSGFNLNATFEAGYGFKFGDLSFKPYGMITANSTRENSYSETGGESVSVNVDARSVQRVDGRVGANLGYEFIWRRTRDGNVTIRPEILVGADRRIVGDVNANLMGSFADSTGEFTVAGQRISEDAEFAGAQISLFGSASTARLRYTYQDRGNFIVHSATVNFRLSF